jgi:hypothetical protein
MTAAFLRNFMPYGAPDLQDAERPHLVRALALGSSLATLLFAIAWSLSLMQVVKSIPIDVPHTVVLDNQRVNVLQPPPLDPIVLEATIARAKKIAVPVPVPDAARFGAIAGLSERSPIVGIDPMTGGRPRPDPWDAPVNRQARPPFVDQLPVPVRRWSPYPDRRAKPMSGTGGGQRPGGEGRARGGSQAPSHREHRPSQRSLARGGQEVGVHPGHRSRSSRLGLGDAPVSLPSLLST